MDHRTWLRLNETREQLRWAWRDFFDDYDILLAPISSTAGVSARPRSIRIAYRRRRRHGPTVLRAEFLGRSRRPAVPAVDRHSHRPQRGGLADRRADHWSRIFGSDHDRRRAVARSRRLRLRPAARICLNNGAHLMTDVTFAAANRSRPPDQNARNFERRTARSLPRAHRQVQRADQCSDRVGSGKRAPARESGRCGARARRRLGAAARPADDREGVVRRRRIPHDVGHSRK